MRLHSFWLAVPMIVLSCAGCGESPPRGGVDVRLVEGTRPKAPSTVDLAFRSPQSGVVIAEGDVQVKLDSRTLEEGKQDEDVRVRLVVDEGSPRTLSDGLESIDLRGLSPGLHVLRAFPVRPSGGSVQAPEGFALTYFFVDDPENPGAFDDLVGRRPQFLVDPILTYNEPRGVYAGSDADSILVDFYVTRAELGPDAYSVRLLIDGHHAYTMTRWAPHYVLGLGNGKHTFSLELRGPGDRRLRTVFKTTEDTIEVRDTEESASPAAFDGPPPDGAAAPNRDAQPTALSGDPECADCTLRFSVDDTLGRLDDPASPGPLAEAVLLETGEVAVSSSTMGPAVFVYGTDGRFLRKIGREGRGPGELASAPMLTVLNGRQLAVLDTRQGRINRYSPDGIWLAETLVPLRAMAFVASGDRYVVSGPRTSPDGEVVETIHVIDRSGEIVSSFGRETADLPAGAGAQNIIRKLVVGGDGTLWAATMSGGRLEHWTQDGDLLQAYAIMDQDLRRQAPLRIDLRRETPPGQISDLAVDPEGRLWIFAAVPDPAFAPDSGTRPSPEQIYDTRILVFDPGFERVIASQQFDTLLRPLGDGWAYDLVETEIGDRRVRVGTLTSVGF